MKQYVIKGEGGCRTFVDVLQKDSKGYKLKIRIEKRWGIEEQIHHMSSRLFESCLRTGYFIEVPAQAAETAEKYA
jgi:hypothetical protein